MTLSPDTPTDLFAAKGRAMPACSKPLAGRPLKNQAGTVAPKPDQAEAKVPDDGPASVLSIDLRRTLVPARSESPRSESPRTESPGSPSSAVAAPARVEPRPATGTTNRPPPSPGSHGLAGPFIGTLVAVSIAAGIFYFVERDHLGATPGPEAPAQVGAEAATAEGPAETLEADRPQSVAGTAPQEAEDDNADAAPEASSLPSFDLVRVEPDGSAVIAGRAAPYADLILLHNGEPIGKVRADWAGEWAFVTDKPLPADRHQITILVNDPDAEITLPQGAEPPSQVGNTGDSQSR
jgi:hypothetical protein